MLNLTLSHFRKLQTDDKTCLLFSNYSIWPNPFPETVHWWGVFIDLHMSFFRRKFTGSRIFSGSFFRSFLTILTFFTSCLFSIKILFLLIFDCRKLSMGATAFLPTGLTSTLSKVSAGCPFSLSSSTFSSFQSVKNG